MHSSSQIFKKKKIAFVVQLPFNVSPGQRFRAENWIYYLEQSHFEIDYFPFISNRTYRILYANGHIIEKVIGTFSGFLRRMKLIFKCHAYDFIFIQREASPIGPPIIEWILAKLFKKKIIIDFDDAIWISQKENPLFNLLKCHWKLSFICKWAYKVSAGNGYLANYASAYNTNTFLLPTVVDTTLQHNKIKTHLQKPVITIGWTGSHSTLSYLAVIAPALEKLATTTPFELLVIANKPPDFNLPNLRFLPWNAHTEISDLLQMDIGLMPLTTDEWSEGKCGFKIIQYLALGIPAIASPVGVNKEIIDHGENGFLCNEQHEWIDAMQLLINDANCRQHFGNNGRKKIETQYSISSQKEKMLHLFS